MVHKALSGQPNAAKGSLVVVIYDELLDQLVAVLVTLSRLTNTLKQRQHLFGFHVGLCKHCSRHLLDDLGARKLGGLFGIICVHHPAARRLGIHNKERHEGASEGLQICQHFHYSKRLIYFYE
jgi:hypothetical protein